MSGPSVVPLMVSELTIESARRATDGAAGLEALHAAAAMAASSNDGNAAASGGEEADAAEAEEQLYRTGVWNRVVVGWL